MDRALFVYNPLSGDRTIPTRLDYLINRFQQNNILLQPYRLTKNEPDKLPHILAENDFAFFLVSGGDGTLNSVLNILLKNGLNKPIGLLPFGTCNDFARSLNLPVNLNECLNVIFSGKTVDVDAGLINEERFFFSTCAGGLFVDVSFKTHDELKKNFGPFAYYLKALSEVAHMKCFPLKIETEAETIEENVLLFLILNGTHGGGFANLIKDADISDGLMDIVLIKNCAHIDLANLFFRVLSRESLNDKNVTILKSRTCKISGSSEVLLSVDGEKGPALPINVRFINKALKVFVK
ncbi:YegS/Rv2252/BmrU family lipid kinase [Thermanaerosceptrum fracticalcis]|jgi:YegS/Rv2252/BmrU family lipid kinase|uniref:YegS/Rv2252/BmrU family lipid kinase n=1 Tax=Thermanaerosceptrum fracticalcis TaxID=1712410 RepID=A0A7G6DYV6_THEFR|nr:YegS/Rv2252/BmrU family lipid kinase [Thermanaerosceptrum fracticalcis]QNB45010.1 YegS/Rv2252/BmrU family lipid kinase [Thermanaerosceptrum fracticalcis]